jgi:tetrapyrrole methylase family protein/MazG family protein
VYHWLAGLGKHLIPFDFLYRNPRMDSAARYTFMSDIVVSEFRTRGRAVVAIHGNPGVLEATTSILRRRAASEGLSLDVIPGISFLDLVHAHLGIEAHGLQVVLPEGHVRPGHFTEHLAMLVTNVDRSPGRLTPWLLAKYPPDHVTTLVWTSGMPDYTTQSAAVAIRDLPKFDTTEFRFASLYVPAA